MKNKIRFTNYMILFTLVIGIMSCDTDESSDLYVKPAEIVETTSLVFHYKGVAYSVELVIDSNGDYIYKDLPKELEVLENIETLATVVSGDQTYFFDNEQESLDYFFDEKSVRSDRAARSSSFRVSEFNTYVRAFEHDNFNGRKLNISKGYQLRDLRKVSFNDVMSSIGIDTQYQNIYNGDVVTLYEHKDFGGKSLKFVCEYDNTKCHFISGDSYNMIPGRTFRGHRKFRSLSFNLFRKWADKVSSIDVKFGGTSVVPPNPPGGGGGGGGTIGEDPVNHK